GRLLHLLRRRVGHRHFGHVEILHLVAATAAAARFQVHHDQLAPALLMHGDNQEEQGKYVKGDRQRKGADQQTERIFHLLKTGRISFVFLAVRLGLALPFADNAVEDESDDERREDKQNNYYCDHIITCSPLGLRVARPRPRSSFTRLKAARSSRRRVSRPKIKFLRSASRRSGRGAPGRERRHGDSDSLRAGRLGHIQNTNHITKYNLWVALENHNFVGRIRKRVMKLGHQLGL